MVRWLSWATLDWISAGSMNCSIAHAEMLEPVTMGQVLMHFTHRLGARAVLTVAAVFARRAYRERKEG